MEIKDYFPLFSSLIVIILFIVDRFLSRNIRKKEMERNFYYKVLLEPNLETITIFFDEVEELYEKSSEKLSNTNPELLSTYLSELRVQVELFKTKRRKFESQLIFPIQQRYASSAETLLMALNEIQDNFISDLDLMHFDSDSIIAFSKKLNLEKAKFLSGLFSPLK